MHSFEPSPRSFFWILGFVVTPVAAQNLFNDTKNLRKIRIYRVALLPKIEVCCSEILHENLVFQRSGCKHFKFIWLYRNREICPGLMHKSLLPHSEGLCPSGRGRDAQRGVYFQCSLHHALSDPMSATASSRTPPSGRRTPPLLPQHSANRMHRLIERKENLEKEIFKKGAANGQPTAE